MLGKIMREQGIMMNIILHEAFNSLGISKEDFISIVNTTMRVDIRGWLIKFNVRV